MSDRIHFFEIEDLPFCPSVIRDGITDILQYSINRGAYYSPIVPLLSGVLEKSGTTRIVDLCSGGGGPWPSLLPQLQEASDTSINVLLTDMYPNQKAFQRIRDNLGGSLDYENSCISALNVPEGIRGFRTIFTGFHHFQPDQARQILADAVSKGDGIGVFEFTHRSFRGLLTPLLAPLGTVLVAPVVKPFRWSRVVLTYILPVLPVCTLFDGIVSCLRTYSTEELQQLVDDLPRNNYIWYIGEKEGTPNAVTFLVGYQPVGGVEE